MDVDLFDSRSAEDGVQPHKTSTEFYDRDKDAIRASLDSLTSRSDGGLLGRAKSLEAQDLDTPLEDLVPLRSKSFFLILYFGLNLGLTMWNKSIMNEIPLPWLLTTFHAAATSVGCIAIMCTSNLTLSKINSQEQIALFVFSWLSTLNIAISNVSLWLVSVPFHQIARTACPVVTVLIYRTVYGRTYSITTYLSIIPIVAGVAGSTAGDYDATVVGASVTAVGVLLACIKTVATNRLMTGSLSLPPLELIVRLSPLAAVHCAITSLFSGEVLTLMENWNTGIVTWALVASVAANGLAAFALNVVSFETNKKVGALTVTVCGNVKQALTILLSIVWFQTQVGLTNGMGMLITIIGAGWYSKVELDSKR